LEPRFSDRVENQFDDKLRSMLQNINDLTEELGRYILKSEIETEYLINFFTYKWDEDEKSEMLSKIFSTAEVYIKDVFTLIIEERFASKVAESFFCFLIDAYIERFLIAGN
jgi:hypothetical protein